MPGTVSPLQPFEIGTVFILLMMTQRGQVMARVIWPQEVAGTKALFFSIIWRCHLEKMERAQDWESRGQDKVSS